MLPTTSTLAIFVFASIVGMVYSNLSYMPTETTKKKICGSRLIKSVQHTCTPPGYQTPCFHFGDSDEFGNGKNVMQKRFFAHHGLIEEDSPSSLSSYYRQRRSFYSRQRRSEGISDLCCKHGCNLKELQEWCCNDAEFEEYKKIYA